MATAAEDPHLGSGPDEDGVSLSGSESDSDSILSDDSVLPEYTSAMANGRAAATLYEACSRNEPTSLQKVLERGVTKEESMELDINGWNGLMLACCKGFVDIVYGLHGCPYIDINQQDNEGNTALMIASQAGHLNTVMYLLNYYPGIDTELRDCRGYTALIKAAMTGRTDVVAALVMAGANVHAVDSTQGKSVRDWALKTGRYETLQRLRRLNSRPKAEQFCESFVPEWPELKERVAKATAEKSSTQKITQRLKNTFGFTLPRDPEDNGCLDHMVRITTSIHSPLISTACRPLCPTSPPEMGKKRLAVSELVKKHSDKELEESSVCHSNGSVSHIIPVIQTESTSTTCCSNADRRDSILSMAGAKAASFIPRSMGRRNSIFPSGCIPHVNIHRPTEQTPKKEKKKKKLDKSLLQPPVWKYKEIKDEKKREKKRAEKEKAEKEKEKKKEKEKEKEKEKANKKSKK